MTISRNPYAPISHTFMCGKCRLPRPMKGRSRTVKGWICLGCKEAK